MTEYQEQTYRYPAWEEADRVHDWRNYINDDLRAFWYTFTIEQRVLIGENAQEIASQEEWD